MGPLEVTSEAPTPDEAWMDYANCIGAEADLFFPARGESSKAARAICRECFVRQDCLDYALETDQRKGIWGGLNRRERNKEARRLSGIGYDQAQEYSANL
jgi:WhiB family redox-sensing transcriptional regulator